MESLIFKFPAMRKEILSAASENGKVKVTGTDLTDSGVIIL